MHERTAQETAYYVSDLHAAVEFYKTKLGLNLIERFEWGFALIDADGKGNTIGLMSIEHSFKDFPAEEGHPAPRLVFQVADLDKEIEALTLAEVKVSNIAGEKGKIRAAHFWYIDGSPFFMWEDGTEMLGK